MGSVTASLDGASGIGTRGHASIFMVRNLWWSLNAHNAAGGAARRSRARRRDFGQQAMAVDYPCAAAADRGSGHFHKGFLQHAHHDRDGRWCNWRRPDWYAWWIRLLRVWNAMDTPGF